MQRLLEGRFLLFESERYRIEIAPLGLRRRTFYGRSDFMTEAREQEGVRPECFVREGQRRV